MDAIAELCPDPIEPEEEEDCVKAEAMLGLRETERKKGRKSRENARKERENARKRRKFSHL